MVEEICNAIAEWCGCEPCEVPFTDVMGVPVTFLDKYCPEQFVLIGHEHDLDGSGHGGDVGQFEVNGCGKYKRILIWRK